MVNFKKYFRVFVFILILALAGSLSVTCSRLEKSQKNERRLEGNASQKRKEDSLKYSIEVLTLGELKESLQFENKKLKALLESEKIKPKKIQRIISAKTQYIVKDTVVVNLDSIKQAVVNDLAFKKYFSIIDSCSTIKAFVSYENSKLDLNIIEKSCNTATDFVFHKQRHLWKFWFIKSRFLGKREIVAEVFDQCGQSKIHEIIIK